MTASGVYMFTDDDLLPLSGLQHLLFCGRQWALRVVAARRRDTDELERAVEQAAAWAEHFVKEFSEYQTAALPWLK